MFDVGRSLVFSDQTEHAAKGVIRVKMIMSSSVVTFEPLAQTWHVKMW